MESALKMDLLQHILTEQYRMHSTLAVLLCAIPGVTLKCFLTINNFSSLHVFWLFWSLGQCKEIQLLNVGHLFWESVSWELIRTAQNDTCSVQDIYIWGLSFIQQLEVCRNALPSKSQRCDSRKYSKAYEIATLLLIV